MTYKVDQFAALHPRVEGEIYVDWDKVRMLSLKGDISTSQHDLLTGQLAKALLEKGRRIEDLEGALAKIRDFEPDRQAWSVNIARAALKGKSQ